MFKFKIGQNVHLVSKLFPSLNGYYKIEAASAPIAGQKLERTNEEDSNPCYCLEGIDGWWAEHSLTAAE